MASFPRALRSVHPDGREATLGGHHVYRFENRTLAHVFRYVVKALGPGRLVELTARDGFDEKLAAFLLDQLKPAKLPPLPAETIRVLPAAFPAPWRFDRVVVVPPRVADRYEHESPVLQRTTYWVFPAYDGEFEDGSDKEAFLHQIRRRDGRHVSAVDWTRAPRRKKSAGA